jgi:ABC-type glutathione transport system ATPase component
MLAVEGIHKSFGRKPVLHGVSFVVGPGETVGLVGESGSGKTTIARCVLGLERVSRGRVLWDGAPLTPTLARRPWRKDIQIVFQDPRSSLNPRWTIRHSLLEPVENWFPRMAGRERRGHVEALIEQVGLGTRYLDRYPHELSTGQCQRACIARALASEPRLLILDEPLSALDVTIQAQILRLLREIQARRGLSYLFISHDVVVLAELCRRILVLERGQIVEEAASTDLLVRPKHPYTRALVADTPRLPWQITGLHQRVQY